MKRSLATRFWAKVQLSFDPDECWIWTAYCLRGYGRFNEEGRVVLAHRFAYETLIGPIPEGMQIDHLCRNRACVNPRHLEPVTPWENMRRGMIWWQANPKVPTRTECKRGHAFTAENTRQRGSKRECKACALIVRRANRSEAKAAV